MRLMMFSKQLAPLAGCIGVVAISEYQGSWSWRDLSLPELIEQTRRDVSYLGGVLPAS